MLRLSVCQTNLQKARLSSQLLQNKLQENTFVGCITEPYTVTNKIVFRPIGYKVIPEATLAAVPRAALYIPLSVQAVTLGHLCVPDAAVAQIKWHGNDVVIVSAYLDIELDVVQPWLSAIMDYVARQNVRLLLTMDSNAHSSFYSDAQSNRRGKLLEDFILRHMLQVQNRGSIPTFQSNRASSVIDVTLTHRVDIWNWHVDTEFNASDHNSIFFDIEADRVPFREIRPWDKADWRKFSDALDKERTFPVRMTCKKLDKEVDRMYKDINAALDIACPRFKLKPKKGKAEWYTEKIGLLHRRVKKQYKKAMETEVPQEFQKYEILRKKFRRRCRRAKNITWRTFVNDTPGPNSMARLSRIALHKDKLSLNVLHDGQGGITEPGTDTIDRLAQVHFPQATNFDRFPSHRSSFAELTEVIRDKFPYVTPKLVRKSLLRFQPKKAPGPDQIKPIVFRYLPPRFIDYLTMVYKISLQLRYTPRKWQESTVVFIPKVGKKDMREGKAYRPIVLSNFFLKGLERLITWEMDSRLKYYPIHPNQHGFQIGKGTEAALSNTCDYIEQFVLRRKYCLGVFLDITSAYDSMSIDHIRSSLYLHGGEENLVEWYYQYLSHRVLHIPLHGESRSLVCSQGFPQGGVASAKFWIISFDPAIQIINRQFTVGNGYADDLSVVFGGSDPDELVPRVQRVIDELVSWGETCNLHFNPEKTVMVGFTRALSKSFTVPICIKGVPLKFSDTVKYLGLLLDKRMTWRPHILEKIALCKRYLLKMANIAHTTWGPRPHLMRWMYRCMVRPKFLYGALLWAHKAQSKGIQARLRRLNRIGMNTYATVHRSTPTRGMEIITDTIPLHIYANKSAVCAYIRLQNVLTLTWNGYDGRSPHIRSHLLVMKHLSIDLGIERIMRDMDVVEAVRPLVHFNIQEATFTDRQAYRQFVVEWSVFTDGSKLNGRVGAGYIIYRGEEEIESRKIRLSDNGTVFQAEISAIHSAALWLMTNQVEGPVTFFVDSQAALMALKHENISSRLVLNAIRMIDMIRGTINLVWVPAHSGVAGNEAVDLLAKEATLLDTLDEIPIAKSQVKDMVLTGLREIWNEEWRDYEGARMTKYFFPRNDKDRARKIYHLSRLQLGRMIRILTGHNNLRYYQSKLDHQISPFCRFCTQEPETFHHFVFECPSLFHSRREIFLDHLPDLDMNWSVQQVLDFSYLNHINRLLDPNSVHDIHLVDTESEGEDNSEVDPDDIQTP